MLAWTHVSWAHRVALVVVAWLDHTWWWRDPTSSKWTNWSALNLSVSLASDGDGKGARELRRPFSFLGRRR